MEYIVYDESEARLPPPILWLLMVMLALPLCVHLFLQLVLLVQHIELTSSPARPLGPVLTSIVTCLLTRALICAHSSIIIQIKGASLTIRYRLPIPILQSIEGGDITSRS